MKSLMNIMLCCILLLQKEMGAVCFITEAKNEYDCLRYPLECEQSECCMYTPWGPYGVCGYCVWVETNIIRCMCY